MTKLQEVSVDKSREDFYKWWEENRSKRVSTWDVWQASRKALVVTLPEVCAFNLCDLLDKKEVIERISAAGITVKGEWDGTD